MFALYFIKIDKLHCEQYIEMLLESAKELTSNTLQTL